MNRRTFLYNSGSLILGCALLPEELFALNAPYAWHENSRPLMGTYCSLAVFSNNQKEADELINSCFDFIERQIAELSFFEQASLTSLLNREREMPRSAFSNTFCDLLKLSAQVNKLSAEGFSGLNGGLTSLWKKAREESFLPSTKEVAQELRRTNSSTIELSEHNIKIHGEGLLEFGGIGKGYIADLAAKYFAKNGARYARVACSGDIAFVGNTEWTIDVVHPRKDVLLGSICAYGNKAVATSGDYVFYKELFGKRIHHLIDLKTGKPARHLQSATILADNAGLADALATSAFMLPADQALKFVSRFSGADALLVDRYGEIHKTKGLEFIKSS